MKKYPDRRVVQGRNKTRMTPVGKVVSRLYMVKKKKGIRVYSYDH